MYYYALPKSSRAQIQLVTLKCRCKSSSSRHCHHSLTCLHPNCHFAFNPHTLTKTPQFRLLQPWQSPESPIPGHATCMPRVPNTVPSFWVLGGLKSAKYPLMSVAWIESIDSCLAGNILLPLLHDGVINRYIYLDIIRDLAGFLPDSFIAGIRIVWSCVQMYNPKSRVELTCVQFKPN